MNEPALAATPVPAAGFETLARSRLDFDLAPDLANGGQPFGGDHALDGDPRPPGRLRPAAVLVPVVTHRHGASIILTTRPTGMRDHSGQIAFPGGKIEPGDRSPCDAALREAEEEIGLRRACVEPIGYLDPYVTGTGYLVVPTLGLVAPPVSLALDRREVADAFEVPLLFLMDPANHQRHRREIGARTRHFYAIPFEDRFIWGATAGILRNLYDRLYS